MNSNVKQIARERVRILFQQAQRTYKADPKLAQSYVGMARRIAMAARVRLPTQYRRGACRVCNAYLVPGETSRVRIRSRRDPHVVITCLSCGSQTRIPLKPNKNVEIKENEQNNKQNEATR